MLNIDPFSGMLNKVYVCMYEYTLCTLSQAPPQHASYYQLKQLQTYELSLKQDELV